MSRASKLFTEPSITSTYNNHEGYPAWERPLEEQFIQLVMCNTLGSTFYASQNELVNESFLIHSEMLEKDPEFYAKALVYARNEGYMRLQPIFGLAMLSKTDWFERIFSHIIKTPKDLADFASIIAGLRNGSQGGRKIKRVGGQWLLGKLSEYWLIKYGAGKEGYSLKDLFITYHPKGAENWMVDYLFGRAKKLGPQVQAFEKLKVAQTDEEKIIAITEGRLPHEVATSFAGKSKEIWNAILKQFPIMALVRNLSTLERHNVIEDNIAWINGQLSNPDIIRKSKMFPYQFVNAFEHITDNRIKDSLRKAVDISFDNIPAIYGKTTVALDISGSMGEFIHIAAIFAITIMKKTDFTGKLFLFDDNLEEFHVSKLDSILSQAFSINVRGGTDTSLPVKKMISEGYQTDNFIMITDEQQNVGTPFADDLALYRKKFPGKTFIIDISPYRNAVTPDWKDVYYIYGWSDQVIKYISSQTIGLSHQVEAVKEIVI